MNKVVLLTGVGGDISQGVAAILRECWPDLYLIGSDTYAEHGGQRYVDYFVTVPPADHPDYLDSIRAIVRERDVNIVIPMSEPELAATIPFLELAPGVSWLTAGSRVVEIGLDKLKTAIALEEMGVPGPWTVPVTDDPPPCYPCILKSRLGSGSRSVFLVNDEEDAAYLSKRHPNSIYQELLLPADREVTCAVYRNREGEIASLLMLRRLTGGFTGWAKVIEDKETSEMCRRIAEGLDLKGSMNIQLRLTDDGPRVFEINPRFSSTVLMRHRLGFSDVIWAMSELEEKRVNFPILSEGMTLVRTQDAVIYSDLI
jgi:carbamoyl-phosphate synthase large subunit